MRHAIDLARHHLGTTGTNPTVGCVIVRDDELVAEGVTGLGGRPHAEEIALASTARARTQDATAFVTLEPCAERSNGAASCSERLVQAGVARVVIACTDSSVLASGRGIARLRAAGIQVELGLLANEAAPLYASYVARRAR